MILRQMRWLCAVIVAAIAMVSSPARSAADTIIQITELGTGETQTFNGTTADFSTTNFLNIQVTVNPSAANTAIGSLTTNVAANLASNFDPSSSLQVIVTTTNFGNPNDLRPASITNTAGASTGIVGGTNQISGVTEILSGGSVIAGPTAASASSFNVNSGGSPGTTTLAAYPALPSTYDIRQTIIVRATPDDSGIASGSTAGGTVGSTVFTSPAPVPAPAGLVLALTAIPVLGLRRVLRRKSA
jgi:hypothetical protein